MLNFDAHIKNSDAAQLRVTKVKTPNRGFHIGDVRLKKLTPVSKCSIGRHVEF